MGLIYIHAHGMVHGDLKGVRLPQLELPSQLTEFACQGQHTDRPNWPRPPSGLRYAHNHFGPYEPSGLELVRAGRHSSMDEPRTYRSAEVRAQEMSPN